MSNEGDSLTTSQFRKGGVVRNGEVAEIVGAAKNGEAALTGETAQKEERLFEINEKGRFSKI